MSWFSGLSGMVKLGLVLAILTAVIGAAHWYNQGLVDQGRAAVELEWVEKLEEQRAENEAVRAKLEREKVAIAKKYHAERAVREAAQKQLDREREDAIKGSAVAAMQCFDERMRDNWDRTSGHGGAASPGEAGRSVAPTVR